MPALLQRFLRIDRREVEFARRGFICSNPEIRDRLENIGRIFLQGYSAALEDKNQDKNQSALADKLNQIMPEHRGFAYEGAAMALALLEGLGLRRNAFLQFAGGTGKQHIFMLHVGAGWAYARLPWIRRRIEVVFKKLHPVLRWLAIDGYGFHEGYFHGKARIGSNSFAPRLSQDARHVFYQGLGRSLWFVNGADVHRIFGAISTFTHLYHGDAWSGVGLACAYAGGIAPDAITDLRRQAGVHAAALAQGAAFAAKARQLAGNPAKHTDVACVVLCRMRAEEAAALCDETFNQIDPFHPCLYQHWRQLLQQSLFSSSEILLRGKSHEPNISSQLAATKPN
jgi:enediyne biosynthesis protein E3